MNNNIISFNAAVSAAKPKINTTTASSNIINISLTNANLKKQKENAGVSNLEAKGIEFKKEMMVREYTFEELVAAEIEKEADLTKNSLEGKSLEEILAEGRETQAEVIAERNRKAVEEVTDLIDSIGEVTLDSEEDIKKAAEAYFNLTDEQKAMMNPEDLKTLIEADNKLAQLKYERDKKAADNVKDLINGIGTVNLNSEDAIVKAAEAYSKLTDQQKAMMDPADLQKLVDADKELARLRQEEAERKRKEQLAKLEKLYKQREDNNGLFHPKKEEEIEAKIRKLEEELGVPHKPDGWESFCNTVEDACATVATFTASVIEGIVDVGETIVDGVVQIGGGAISYVVGAIDEEAGAAMQKGIQDFVSYDASGSMYDAWVQASGIDPEIAYGLAHTAGNIAGQVVGYAAISMIPGGAAVAAVAGGLAAAGAAAESAYANGATFNEAMISSTAAGVMGAVGGAATNKLGSIAKGATSLKGVAGYTAAGALTGSAEPLLNSAVEYATYGNNDGKSYWEFMDESGGWMKVAMGAGAGGLSTGMQSLGGYNNYQHVNKNINNLENMTPDQIADMQRRFNNMGNEQVYNVVQNSNNNYFKNNLDTYDLINKNNAAEFIVFNGFDSNHNTAAFNLDWPSHAGYDPDSITSLKTLIDSSPDGKIQVSRVGGDGGHAIGTDWTSSSSQRSIPSSSSTGTAGIFDGNKYVEAVDICASAGDDISKVNKLIDLGYDKTVAASMVSEFNGFSSLPEISGVGGLNEVLSPDQISKYGYAGNAAAWTTPSVQMKGGAGQMNSIFSWGTLKQAGIVTDTMQVTF